MRPSYETLHRKDQIAVRTCPLFAGLTGETFTKVIASASAISHPTKSTVFREGEPATDIFIVVSGWVKLYRISATGDEAIINIFKDGQSFAEAVALTRTPYPASAETISDCRIVRMPSSALIAAMHDNIEISLAMLASTTMHLHRLVAEIARLKGQNGFARVIEFLKELVGESEESTFKLPFEKQILARHLGMQPESLSRALRRLRDFGIEINGAHVTLTHPNALARAASEVSGE